MEYLDNVLSGKLRNWLIPVLEHLPVEERIKRGAVLLRSRPRGVDATLRALLADPDPVVAAAAVHLAGTHGIRTLDHEVDRLAADRDADRIVTDAAAWSRARRGGSRPDGAWAGALPAVEVVDRLRRLPLFASVGVGELFRVTAAGRQVEYAADAGVFEAGTRPVGLLALLEGTLETTGNGPRREIAAPAAPGFEEALRGSRMAKTIRTTSRAVTLVVDEDDLRTLLADDTELVRGLFRTLAEMTRASSRLDRAQGNLRTLVDLKGARTDFAANRWPARLGAGDDADMTDVEKGPALSCIPLFARVAGVELLQVAAIAEPVRVAAGERFSDESSDPSLAIVLAGELALRAASGTRTVTRAMPGDVVGMHETLVGAGQGLVVATMPSLVLRIDREQLFDLLGERPDLLQQIFSAVFDR